MNDFEVDGDGSGGEEAGDDGIRSDGAGGDWRGSDRAGDDGAGHDEDDDRRSAGDAPDAPDGRIEPGRPSAENVAFVILGALGTLYVIAQIAGLV